jgi:hypothetical protein
VQLTLGFRSAAFDLVLYAFTASTIVLMVKRFNDLGWPPWIVCASVAINWLAYFAQSSGVVGEGAARAAVFFWVQIVTSGAVALIFFLCGFLRGAGSVAEAKA